VLRYDFEDSVGYWVISAARAMERELTAELRPLGITFRQCQVLAALAMHGALSQAELARELGIEPPTLTGVLTRMERDGWVERSTCPTDRRKNLVHPLPHATPVWDGIVAAARRVRGRATAGLTAAEQHALRTLLARVRENLTDHVTETVR